MHLSQNSALFSKKRCTTIAAMPQLQAGTDGNTALREGKVLAWEKGPGMGKADYFKD